MSEEEENCEYQQTTDGSPRDFTREHRHDLDTRSDVRILGQNLEGDQSVDKDDEVTYDDNYADASDEDQEDDGDVYAQLARKERDLLLAAQLGKALLEENEELRRQNMALSQECSQRMEEWQQQKHELQMQLAQRQSEYESTIRDLNDDLTILQERLDNRDHQEWAGNHQHASTMRHLQQHCEYLSEQLQQSQTSQKTLESEVRRLKETAESQNAQLCHRDSCIGHLEGEVSMLQYKNNEAEAEMKAGKDQCTSLITELEEAHERILLLEKQRRELETQLHQVMNELRELQETNNMLQAELDRLNSRHHNDSGSSQTLFSELYQSSHSSLLGPEQFGQENNLDRITSLSAEMLDEDNFEYDEDFITGMNPNYSSPIYGHEPFGGSVYMCEGEVNISGLSLDPDSNKDNNRDGEQVDDERKENREEEKCRILPHSEAFEESATSGTSYDSSFHPKPKQRVTLTSELEEFMQEMSKMSEEEESHLDQKDSNSETDDENEEWPMSTLQRQVSETCQHLNHQHLTNALQEYQNRLQDYQARMSELQKICDELQDAACGQLSLDKVIRQTRQERDNARDRCAQLELDVTTLTSQLITVVHQKVALSQELDQWQVDLSEVLKLQMECRVSEQHRSEQTIAMLEKGLSSHRKRAETDRFINKRN